MQTRVAPMLETRGLAIGYHDGKKQSIVMSGLDLRLRGGSLTVLLGRNGIGKSTLLRTIAGAQPSFGGTVQLDGNDVAGYGKKELSRKLSLVYTDRTQAGGLTVWQLVSLGRYPHTGFFGRLDRHDREIVERSMAATGIAHKGDAFVAELSDGERQKAMIARALAQETPIIMLDEPTAFLDVASRIEVMALLHSLAREQGKAVLLSTHDVSQALQLADELWVVTDDRHVLCGCTEDLILSGAMRQMFSSAGERGGATFDMEVGDFCAQLPTDSCRGGYAIECCDKLLSHWLANALRRNGFSTAANSLGTIIAAAANDIAVKRPSGEVVRCTSVSELLAAIM